MFAPPISQQKSRERSEHQPQRRAVCRRRSRNNAFPFPQLRRRRRQLSEHRRERSEESNKARCASSSEIGLVDIGGLIPRMHSRPVEEVP
jgi:hypothetical protein